jgi:hypothetical protein
MPGARAENLPHLLSRKSLFQQLKPVCKWSRILKGTLDRGRIRQCSIALPPTFTITPVIFQYHKGLPVYSAPERSGRWPRPRMKISNSKELGVVRKGFSRIDFQTGLASCSRLDRLRKYSV